MKVKIENDLFLRALRCEPTSRVPIWLMRQAGRYMPAYQQLRQKAGGFLTLCQTPEYAAEVTLQPIDAFNLDAAILFSDILTIPAAMQLDLQFFPDVGPVINQPIRSVQDIKNKVDSSAHTNTTYVYEAVNLAKKALANRVPLIGFSGSPWTLACYMVEGKLTRNLQHIKALRYTEPAALHIMLDKLATSVAQYCLLQIAQGVDAIMLFDTWGGQLSHQDYLDFSLRYMQKIMQSIHEQHPTPVIIFTKNSYPWLSDIAKSDPQGIGIDWTISWQQAQRLVPANIALQGNMDPVVLLGSESEIHHATTSILQQVGHRPGFIFNLGHGVLPQTPQSSVQSLVDLVQNYFVTKQNSRL